MYTDVLLLNKSVCQEIVMNCSVIFDTGNNQLIFKCKLYFKIVQVQA